MSDSARRGYFSEDQLQKYRQELAKCEGDREFVRIHEDLELWARWHAGEFTSGHGGGRGMLPAYNEFHDMPRCTVGDVNGTSFELHMMAIESAYNALPKGESLGRQHNGVELRRIDLQTPVFCYYRRSMGYGPAAIACGISERTFKARLNMACGEIARYLKRR